MYTNCILDPQREYQIVLFREERVPNGGVTTIEKTCIPEMHIISDCSYVAGSVQRCIITNQHWWILAGGVQALEGLSAGVWHASEQINIRWIDLITNKHEIARRINCCCACLTCIETVMSFISIFSHAMQVRIQTCGHKTCFYPTVFVCM
jgi:hypothetical protein